MRLKGINVVEQHVEKIVAGVFAVALLGMLAWQFIAKPSQVKVGTVDKPIAEAYDEVAAQAKRVAAKVSISEPAGMPSAADAEKVVAPYAGFDKAVTKPVSPNDKIAALDRPTPIGAGAAGTVASSDAIAELAVPAPTGVVAATFLSTVAASEHASPDVAKILPAAQPFDKAAVTVEGMFDGAKLKEALAHDPDGAGPIRAIPKNWYDGSTYIYAVELHRQMRKPDGSWSATERVAAMPGRTLLLDSLDKLNDALTLKEANKFATEQVELVRRTPYYNSSFGEKWIPPSEREIAGVDETNKANLIRSKKGELTGVDSQIKSIDTQLVKLGQPAGPAPAPGGGGRGGGGGGGAAGGGGGGGGSPPPAPSGPSLADESRKKSLTAQRVKLVERRAKIVGELRALGEPVEGDVADAPPDPTAKPKAEPPLLDNPSIKLWAHDVFVERGKTYRYQMSIVLTNPYFGHSAAMIPDQASKLAKAGVMRSAASEWTDPITVDPETYLFFTSAQEDDPALGRVATARAEVYQFKWGFWRRGAKEVQAGDSVVAEITMPDFTTLLAAPAADPNNPGAGGQPQPGPGPGGGRPGGGGKGGGATGAAPSPQPAPGRPDGPAVAAGAQVPMTKVDVVRPEIMLGVAPGQTRDSGGKARTASEVFVQEAGGGVVVVTPEEQRLDANYGRVSRSAERGAKELTPQTDKGRPAVPGLNPNAPGGNEPPGPGGRGG